jgi:hypothetical protein
MLKHVVWARDIRGLDPSSKLVLITICSHVGKEGIAWPSIRKLSEETGLTERCIYMKINELEGSGYLSRHKKLSENGKTMNTNYTINMKLNYTNSDQSYLVPPLNTVQGEGEPGSGGRVNTVHPLYNETKVHIKSKYIKKIYKRKIKSETELAEDYVYDASAKTLASEFSLNITFELAKFKDHAISHGRKCKDWNAAFRNWLRTAHQYNLKRGTNVKQSKPETERERSWRETRAVLGIDAEGNFVKPSRVD